MAECEKSIVDRDTEVVEKGGHFYPTSKETNEEFVVTMVIASFWAENGSLESCTLESMDEKSCSTGIAYSAGRGIVTYVGTAGKIVTEVSVWAFVEADTVSEPCHCDFTSKLEDSATTTS